MDRFKESLDQLDAAIENLSIDNVVLVLGDLNADPGALGGPCSTTSTNKQGRNLLRYLRRWNYVSAHLHLGPTDHPSHAYLGEAHGSYSTEVRSHTGPSIYFLPRLTTCCVLDESPLVPQKPHAHNRIHSQCRTVVGS